MNRLSKIYHVWLKSSSVGVCAWDQLTRQVFRAFWRSLTYFSLFNDDGDFTFDLTVISSTGCGLWFALLRKGQAWTTTITLLFPTWLVFWPMGEMLNHSSDLLSVAMELSAACWSVLALLLSRIEYFFARSMLTPTSYLHFKMINTAVAVL